jgi:hypothetical protein
MFAVLLATPLEEQKRGTSNTVTSPQAGTVIVGHNQWEVGWPFQIGFHSVRDVRVARFGKMGKSLVEPVLFSFAAEGVAMTEGEDMPVFMRQNVNQIFSDAEMSVEIDHVGLVRQRP